MEIFAITIPVRSIAMGDIQSPETLITESSQFGRLIPLNPIIIPISIATNIGFIRDLRPAMNPCFLFESAINSLGTPHK